MLEDVPNNPNEGTPRSQDAAESNTQSVNSLFEDINKFNHQFSAGAMLSGLVGSLMDRSDDVEDPKQDYIPGQELNTKKDEKEISAQALEIMHGATLKKIGLAVEPVTGGVTITGAGGSATTGEVAIKIADKENFLGFLQQLSPDEAKDESFQKNMEYLTGSLTRQIASMNLEEPSDEALNLFGSMDKIISEYKRLGLSDKLGKLEIYLQHARQGDLKEFVDVDNKGLFQEPGKGFGPADWQSDATPEFLRNKWTGAIAALNNARQNPKAAELASELETHLKRCVAAAKEQVPQSNYWSTEKKVELLKELTDAELSLNTPPSNL